MQAKSYKIFRHYYYPLLRQISKRLRQIRCEPLFFLSVSRENHRVTRELDRWIQFERERESRIGFFRFQEKRIGIIRLPFVY